MGQAGGICVDLYHLQLIGDDVRGWAWTKALLALPANEIHLCGDGSAVDLVRKMAREMGEGFEMREYKRFTPVKVSSISFPLLPPLSPSLSPPFPALLLIVVKMFLEEDVHFI